MPRDKDEILKRLQELQKKRSKPSGSGSATRVRKGQTLINGLTENADRMKNTRQGIHRDLEARHGRDLVAPLMLLGLARTAEIDDLSAFFRETEKLLDKLSAAELEDLDSLWKVYRLPKLRF